MERPQAIKAISFESPVKMVSCSLYYVRRDTKWWADWDEGWFIWGKEDGKVVRSCEESYKVTSQFILSSGSYKGIVNMGLGFRFSGRLTIVGETWWSIPSGVLFCGVGWWWVTTDGVLCSGDGAVLVMVGADGWWFARVGWSGVGRWRRVWIGWGCTLELRGVDPIVRLVLWWKRVVGMVEVCRWGESGGRSKFNSCFRKEIVSLNTDSLYLSWSILDRNSLCVSEIMMMEDASVFYMLRYWIPPRGIVGDGDYINRRKWGRRFDGRERSIGMKCASWT